MKKSVVFLLVVVMLAGYIPAGVQTSLNNVWAAEDTNMSEMDALSALGIDSSAAPEGFDENDTSNPYGKDTVTINPVNELYVVGLNENTSILPSQVNVNITSEDKTIDQTLKGTLYGHDDYSSKTTESIMNSIKSTTIASGYTTATGKYIYLGDDINKSFLQSDDYSITSSLNSETTGEFSIAASKVVNGNFDGNEEGKSAQTVLVYAGVLNEHGGLYMRVGDAEEGTYGSAIELIPTSKSIGNASNLPELVKENFMTDPYLMQNYLQATAGDYDGDGTDEIAVFVPEHGKSRIVVYKLKTTTGQSDTAYRNADQWQVGWTYSLKETEYVSNMVSLVSGDFNEDGVTDLGATWGYYYGPSDNKGSKAVVMFGAKGSMLQEAQEFDLTYGDSEIVRASFTFGDLTGSGSEVLILGGQYAKDLKENKLSRYVALYSWNGTSFVANTSKNFDLFAKDEDGNYENPAMAENGDKFYSSSLCPANLAVINQGLSKSPYLYLDSLLIQYGDNGLQITQSLDQAKDRTFIYDNYLFATLLEKYYAEYVEYGAVSGDLGGLGYDTVVTMRQTMSHSEKRESKETTWNYYYKSWWDKFWDDKTWYTTTSTTDACNQFRPGITYMTVWDIENRYYKKSLKDSSTSICMPNTDNDTSFMRYKGKEGHYFKYTDPEVLAVLASPPYFKDLINRDDLSGSYAESTTSYSSTKGSGGGDTYNSTIEAGTYVSVEQEFSVFGVTVASAEAEASITKGFTHETEKMSTMEQTISYTATAGEDMIAFYSIPLEVYEYTAYTPNADGTYDEQNMTVNIPHIAAVQLLSLDAYENIAKDYDALPQISGTVLTHKLGDPSTYPSSENGYLDAVAYSGDWSRVGYSSNEGGASIAQEISMSEEESTSYSVSTKIESKVGAGAGGVKAGVTFGSEEGAGWVTTSTSGNSFSGELQNMPIEAEEFGYTHAWKIFSYLYDDGKVSFPVVNYLVTDITAPAPLPEDFEQNVAKTTDTDIAFTWTYDKMVAGFQIYRYYEFPDGSGSYGLKFIPMTDGTYDPADGLYHFEFIDSNLSPYTDYQYQIQTARAAVPNNSILSEVVSARTKTDVGYPEFQLNGLDEDGYLRIYPDSISSITAVIENADNYGKNISYQWQKLTDGVWTDMSGRTSDKLTFTSSGSSDEGSYRCRTNVIYFDSSRGDNYYISAYSDVFETKYSKRTPVIVEDSFKATTFNNDSGGKGANIDLKFVSGNANHYTAPQGNVTFTVKGTDYVAEYTVALEQTDKTNEDGKFISLASLNINDLPDGVYEVSAYYSGNRVFQSLSTSENETFLVGDNGYQLLLKNGSTQSVEYTYGDMITPTLQELKNDGGITSTKIVSDPVDYKISNNLVITEDGSFKTPNIGTYTIKASLSGEIVAEREFLVSQREITVEAIQTAEKVGKGEVESKLPELIITSGTMAFDEKLSDLNLRITATNTAGNPVILDNNTEPGNYTIIGTTSSSTDPKKFYNYNVVYTSGIYTIIGQTYLVDIVAEKYKDRDVGTITLSNSDDGQAAEFSAGTELLFYATPYEGYEVDSWSALAVDSGNEIVLDDSQFYSNKTRLALTMNAEKTLVTVTFKKSKTTLTTAMEGEGTVVCDNDPAFINGGYVNSGAEITFTATPQEGYTFKKWKVESGGITREKEGTINEDGSNTLTLTMGTSNTVLRAIFERDSYTITLSDNLEAVYKYKVGDLEGSYAEKTVYSGAKIVGDTEVLVKVRAGYEVSSDADWIVNGTTVTPSSEGYKFNITEDTTVSVETTQLRYNITKVEGNGTISVSINGSEATELTDVAGGSKVIFTAHPDHGYAFDSYTVTGTEKFTQDGVTLTIDELGSDVTVKANFTKSTDYKIKVDFGNRASGSYILYDAFGIEVERDTVESVDYIDVCHGDDLKLIIKPNSGYMIDKWIIDGTVDNIRDKEYRFENISKDIDVQVETISQTSYTVNYSVYHSDDYKDGSILSATTDGVSFPSGFTDIGGNSTVVITSSPNVNNMVDHWTINGDTVLNDDNTTFIGKVLTIDSLTSSSTIVDIKVYFTEQVDHTIDLSETNVAITWEYTPNDAISKDIRHGAKAVFIITPDEGYRIVSAEVYGEEYTIVKNEDSDVDDYGTWTVTVDTVNNDLIVSAIAKEIHTITIETVDGGTLSSNTTTSYSTKAIEGEKVDVYQNPDLDYTFDGWNVSGDREINVTGNGNDGFSFVMPDGDVTVSAAFKDISTIDISYEVYDKNSTEENGYDGTLSAEISREGVSGYPKSIFNDELNGEIVSIHRGYEDEYVTWPMSTVTFTANPDRGYKVLKWTIDGVKYNSPMDLPNPTDSMNTLILNVEESTDDMEVIVQFEPIGEEITYGVAGTNGKFISAINQLTEKEFISGNIVSDKTDILFEVEPDEGYEVEAWFVDGSVVLTGANNTYTYEADGENGAVITVKFARVPFTVEYGGENGSVTSSQVESGETVRGDTEVTFTAEADPGYRFDSYSVEGSTDYTSTDDPSITVVITADTMVTANFVTDENCIVNYGVVGENGNLEAVKDDEVFTSGSQGAAKDMITFTATPDTNYKVKAWTVDGDVIESDDITYNLKVSKASHHVTVEFERSHYIVNFGVIGENGTITGESTGDIAAGDSLAKDSTVKFTATPDNGYQVKVWKLNDDVVIGSSEKLTYEIKNLSEDTTVTVEFEEIPEYTISIVITGAGEGTVTAFVNDVETPIVNGMLTVKNHDIVKCIAIPKDEYNTAVWSTTDLTDCEINNINILLKDVTADITITASFKIAELITVKADAVKASETDTSPNGRISAKAGYGNDLKIINAVDSTVNVTKGKTLEFKATPDAGYMVKGWLVNDIVVDELSNTLRRVPETNINVGVMFEPIAAYEIPANGEKYTVSNIIKIPDELPAAYDDSIRQRGTVTFTFTPETGYYFNELTIWDVDCLTKASSDEGITENIINVVDNDDYSYTITLTNVTKDIVCAAKAVKPIVTIEEAEFGEITASYLQESQTITVNSGDLVPVNTELTVKATADDGYRFKAWGDFTNDKTRNPIKIVATNNDIVLAGKFEIRSSGGGGFVPEENPIDIAIKAAKKNEDGKLVAKVEVTDPNKKGIYEQDIPKDFFDFDKEEIVLEIETPEGTVALPNDMFDELPGKDVQISIEQVDLQSLDLPEDVKEQIGNKPIIDINLAIGGKKTKWSSDDKEITVSISFTPTEDEIKNPHKVIAVYIDDNGNVTKLTASDYDPEKGAIVFKTKHTSYYSVQYVDKNFDDIGTYKWAEEAIEALAARGVINGVSETSFAPEKNITRADFVLLITKFLGLENSGTANFADVKEGTYYYDAVATAKDLGIITGSGDNTFNPQAFISRQDMMVIIERALKISNKGDKLKADSGKSLDNFTDREAVSSYAADSVDYLIKKDVVSGAGMTINPKSNTKRAEVAALLYKILGQLNK